MYLSLLIGRQFEKNASCWPMKTFGAQTRNNFALTISLDNKYWFDVLASYANLTDALTDLFRLPRYMSMGTSPSTAPLISLSVSISSESSLTGNQICKYNTEQQQHWRTGGEISHGRGECSSHLTVTTTTEHILYFKSCCGLLLLLFYYYYLMTVNSCEI